MKQKNLKQEIVCFRVFLVMWNQVQNQTTPAIHLKIATWLEKCWKNGNRNLLLMAFRSCGKSTLVGIFAAWLLYRHPDLRILVLAADLALARKMVRNVKRIIEKHPLTQHLKPPQADQWATDRFTINRDKELRDPSMLAKGVTANLTGTRADLIICDDVEVPNTCDTAEKRAELRERLSELDFILVQGGTQLYVGTPHSWYTIYADDARKEIGEEMPFLHNYRKLKIPIMDKEGKSVWPERYSDESIMAMKRKTGPNLFSSQMLLQPVNIAESYLDVSALNFYEDDLVYSESQRESVLEIRGRKLVSASAWWDPAFGHSNGDHSVVAVVYTDDCGEYWLHHVGYIKINPHDKTDEATQQCRQVAQIVRNLYVPLIALETNGLGKFLPNILRRELNMASIPTAVREVNNRKAKSQRIIEAFDAVLAARALHVHRSIARTSFITEMQEWRPMNISSSNHDDALDAVAGALSMEPVRINRGQYTSGKYIGKRHNWMGSGQSSTAKTDFEV